MKLKEIKPEDWLVEAKQQDDDDRVQRPYGVSDHEWENGYRDYLLKLKKSNHNLYNTIINGN